MVLIRSVATVGAYTMASRVLGFLRDVLIAAALGAGPVADAFFVAFRLPNLFRRLFAEGAFNAAFVPLFTRRIEEAGREAARKFAEETLAAMLTLMLGLTLAAEIAMPLLVLVIAPGFAHSGEQFELAVAFSRITFPYLPCMMVMALYAGMLNVLYRFAAAAAAPILLNLVMIAAILSAGGAAEATGYALSWAVAAAGLLQAGMLAVAGRRAGMRLRLRLPRLTPGVRRLSRLMLPGVLGAGVLQINLLVGTIIASLLPTGAIAYLYYADRVYQLPLGVIGVAIGTALLPQLAREIRVGQPGAAAATLNRALELGLLFTLPAAAALAVSAGPIVAVLFERGAFGADDTGPTAMALAAYAAGLPAYVVVRILSPAFFAREDTRTPMVFAVVTMVVNVVLGLVLMWFLAHVGIALASALAAWLNAGLLAHRLRAAGHMVTDARLRRRVPRLLLATAAMAGALFAIEGALAPALAAGEALRAAALAVLCLAGAAVFFAAAIATGATDVRELRRHLRRRPSA